MLIQQTCSVRDRHLRQTDKNRSTKIITNFNGTEYQEVKS